jgi:putative membrane-bound dehydrogenase-like protein
MKRLLLGCALVGCLAISELGAAETSPGVCPTDKNGKPLNFDFEAGTLKDWTADGSAFARQPVKGDIVALRRSDMKSQHEGDYWVGSFEVSGDQPQGTLTSAPFKLTQPFASFLVAGGSHENTRVELVRTDTQKVVFKTSGYESENLRPVVADLREHLGQEIFIRVVDQENGHWGHINFDNFKLHAQRPRFANELDPAKLAKQNEMPPPDLVKFAGLSAEEAAKAITMPPGFKATLFAGEPDVQQPIGFAIDDRGRLWVAEGFTYPIRVGQPPEVRSQTPEPTADQLKDIFNGKDRIIVLEDTEGDGKFNKRTVFMENLNLVSGIEIGFGGIWIGAAPYLMHVPVTDWDDPKPAGNPKILLDGWDYKRDTHETLNTFTWGPDGWLYGCHGVFCPSLVGKPGAPESKRQWVDAAVWRYHPTKHVFEVFAEGTSNPWGVDFDERGQCWIEACVIPHLFHMVQGGRYHRQGGEHYAINLDETARNEKHRERGSRKPIFPYVYEDIKTVADHVHYAGNKGPHAGNARSGAVGGGHAHAGLMIYQGDNWPEQYRGKIFMNNIHGARINMDIPERAGSGFVGRHGLDIINFNDKWSQVLNMLQGPDGSVYMIDWYDKNECHHNDTNGHDRSNGRIFKISYGEPGAQKRDLQKLGDEELVGLLLERNAWQARHAQRILQERAARLGADAVRLLRGYVSGASALLKREKAPDDIIQLRALWTVSSIGSQGPEHLVNQVTNASEYLRAWAIQLICEDKKVSENALKEFTRLAREDKSPVVRLYLASAMQRLPIDDRWEIIEALSQRAEDAGDHNIPLMVWYAAEPLPAKDFNRALALAEKSKLPRLLEFTVRRAAALNTPEAFAAITRTLDRAASVPPASRRQDITQSPGEPPEARCLNILNGLSAALRGQRNVAMPQGWESVEAKLSASANSEIRAQVQSLSLTFGSTSALASLKTTLTDPTADLSARRTALDSLLQARPADLPPILQNLLRDSNLRAPCLRALASFDDPQTSAAILSVYPLLNTAEKRDALNSLASRAAYAKSLLTAVEQKQIASTEITAEMVRQLRNLKNPEIDELLTKVWGVARDSSADKQQEIARYRGIYHAGGSQPGDALRGRVVFAKVCAQCHTLFDSGGKVGPDLTGSNRGDLDYILQNIVDPNAVIPNEYRSSTVETKDDRVLTGLIKEQTEQTITVVTANETVVLPRNEIQSVQESQLSMMPEALLAPLNDQEVRDLVYYLRQPGQAQLLATPETISFFFNGKDLSNWDGDTELWKVENGEIVGRTTTGLKHNAFLMSQLVLGDFRLVCKVKLTPNSENSGIQFRSEPHGEYEMKGLQADVGKGWWGKLYEENGRALLWDKPGDGHVKLDDWNTYEIVAVGSRVRTAINGKLCVDLDDPQISRRGIIGLQVHSGGPMEIRFKDFQLELNPKLELTTASKN